MRSHSPPSLPGEARLPRTGGGPGQRIGDPSLSGRRNPGLPLYGRYVSDRRFCASDQIVTFASVPPRTINKHAADCRKKAASKENRVGG